MPWANLSDEIALRPTCSSTPSTLGVAGQPALAIDLDALPERAVVADAVYVPLRTPLIEAAQRARTARRGGAGDAAPPGRARLRALVRQAPRR